MRFNFIHIKKKMKYIISKDNLFSAIIFLLITGYISGPALINLFLTLIAIYGIYFLIKYKFKPINRDYYLVLFLIYILVQSLILKNFDSHSLTLIRFFIIIIFFNFLLRENKISFNLKFIYPLIFLISFDGIIQYFFGYNILGFMKYENYRLTGFFNDEPILGSFLMKFTIPFLFFINCFKKSNYIKSFFILAIFISLLCVILSGERLAMIQLIIGLILFLYLNIKNIALYKLIMIPLTIIAVVSIIINDDIKNRIVGTGFEVFNLSNNFIFNQNNNIGSINNYLYNFESGIEVWKKNKLFGNGYRYYNKNCKDILENLEIKKGCSTHPHNIYIEILSDYGLFGLIFFLIFIFNILLFNYNLKNGFNIVYILMIFPFFPSQSIFSSYYQSIFLIIICMSLIPRKNYKIDSSSKILN